MKKILIIADGHVAHAFLERIVNLDASSNIYHVIYYKENTLPSRNSDKFLYYEFDPTSFSKLSLLLEDVEFYQAMLILGNKMDLLATFENIRKVDTHLPVILLDKWRLGLEDKYTTVIEAQERLANILANDLPDIPLSAQNIGLGQGEIMEFKIPFGSSYVYRHVGNIEQKRWRIAAIFREQQILLPEPKTMLLPNDSLLVIGNPNVLKGVYKSINRQFGQFPLPFGQNIYCFIDMVTMSEEEIERLSNDAILMHAKLNSKKLVFRILHPRYGKLLDKLKRYHQSSSMEVVLDFLSQDSSDLILNDVNQYYIGMIVTNAAFFQAHRKLLYRLKLPIFKIGVQGFFAIHQALVLGHESDKVEQVSSIIFDIASQLDFDISLFEFEGDESEDTKKIIEHFENLSKLFEGKVRILKTKRNPIRELLPKNDFLQFVVFDPRLLEPRFFSYFSTDIQRHYFRFMDKYQLFLPCEL